MKEARHRPRVSDIESALRLRVVPSPHRPRPTPVAPTPRCLVSVQSGISSPCTRHINPQYLQSCAALRGFLHCPERQPRSPYSTSVQWDGRQESFSLFHTYTPRTRDPTKRTAARTVPVVNNLQRSSNLLGRLGPACTALPFIRPRSARTLTLANEFRPGSFSNAHCPSPVLCQVAGEDRAGHDEHT